MPTPTLAKWFAKKPSKPSIDRSTLRVGIPRVLNIWTSHQFWIGFLVDIGIQPQNIIFSSETTEEQYKDFGKGRGTVDCCYPVKTMTGHYGELVFSKRKKVNIILSPMINNIPSVLDGHVQASITCPRVMAGPENIKAGFLKEKDIFAENDIQYVTPFVTLGDDERIISRQLHEGLKESFGITLEEATRATKAGFTALNNFEAKARQKSREVLAQAIKDNKPVVMVLARPYHMDSGLGHEIEADLQAHGYSILWMQYFPIDEDIMSWLFGDEIARGEIKSAFDISDVWHSSYSANTSELMWGAKVAARLPNITCVIRFSSYECGMDQPTYTPAQKTVESSGTMFFKFGDLDSTKPAGGIKIRIETIVHYLEIYSEEIMKAKQERLHRQSPFAKADDVTANIIAAEAKELVAPMI